MRREGTLGLALRPGRRAESVAIAMLMVGLTAVCLLATHTIYETALDYLSRPGETLRWIIRPAETGLVLVLGLATCGWLVGAWLGERHRRHWAILSSLTLVLAIPMLLLLEFALGVTRVGSRFVPAGTSPGSLWLVAPAVFLAGLALGGLLGSWWAGLVPDARQ